MPLDVMQYCSGGDPQHKRRILDAGKFIYHIALVTSSATMPAACIALQHRAVSIPSSWAAINHIHPCNDVFVATYDRSCWNGRLHGA